MHKVYSQTAALLLGLLSRIYFTLQSDFTDSYYHIQQYTYHKVSCFNHTAPDETLIQIQCQSVKYFQSINTAKVRLIVQLSFLSVALTLLTDATCYRYRYDTV